jgi:hypothetical protein
VADMRRFGSTVINLDAVTHVYLDGSRYNERAMRDVPCVEVTMANGNVVRLFGKEMTAFRSMAMAWEDYTAERGGAAW